MQSTNRIWVAAAATIGLFGLCGVREESAGAADRPTPAANLEATPGESVAAGNQLQLGRRRIGQAYVVGASNQAPAVNAPPAPAEADAPATDAPAGSQATAPAGNTPSQSALPRIPFMAPPGAAAIHERLRAKRLARVQQMKQQALQNGDTQGVERAQYLEGMVNELHNKGLFNFGQKVMSAMQEGKLQGLLGGGAAAGSAPATGSAEMPDTDLGAAAPLPDVDLGTPAPLPTDDANAQPAPESGPQLPSTDAPPANN